MAASGARAPSQGDGRPPSSSSKNGAEDGPARQRDQNCPHPLHIVGARHNNLKNVDIEIPLGAFVCITGASGSGKSSLVNDIIAESLLRDLMGGKGQPGEHDRIEGVDQLDKLIVIDQSPIGRTPRSNPATYIKLFDDIRNLYTQLPESKRRGYKPGRFSFNVQGGRCEACERQWLEPPRNGFSGRRLGHVPRVQRPPF